MRAIKSGVSFFTCSYQFRNHKVSFTRGEEEYECNHTWALLLSIFGHLSVIWRPNNLYMKREGSGLMWKMKKKHLKWGLASAQIYSHDLTHCWLFQSREREKKTLDNHQCLQYLSSKRLKAHIAYNWIWFALPASVREIKGKHKNPHDSFSSRWQARPNRSWKEYLWRKPSHRGCWKWQSWGTMNT